MENNIIPMKKEQVAGFYRFMLGDFEINALYDSSLQYPPEIFSDFTSLNKEQIEEMLDNDFAPKTVSVVFARGDSMADKIESGDALIVDESKNYINNGKVYAFVYDSELFCKQLKKTADGITAISFNKDYKPFEIDKTKQFAVVGQVIGAMKRI